MINLMTQTLAVPYGYTRDTTNMDDSDVQWHDIMCTNNTRNLTSITNGGSSLPDLILDTPPPSPLRRAHSYHFTFSEKSPQTALPSTSIAMFSTPYCLPPTPTSLPPTPSTSHELTITTVSVEHIQAVRRQILANPEARVPPTQLPQLNWVVPLPSRCIKKSKSEPQIHQQETEDQTDWKTVGGDLRKVADKFHLDHAVVLEKNRRSNTSIKWDNFVIPLALTRCLQVSLVAVLCWRLLSKFR